MLVDVLVYTKCTKGKFMDPLRSRKKQSCARSVDIRVRFRLLVVYGVSSAFYP